MHHVLVVGAVEDRAGGQADKRAALGVVDERFAGEVEVQRDVGALPGRGQLARDVKPAAVPGAAPLGADGDRAVGKFEPARVGNGLGRHGALGCERDAFDDDFAGETAVDLLEPGDVDVGVEVCHVG